MKYSIFCESALHDGFLRVSWYRNLNLKSLTKFVYRANRIWLKNELENY